MINYFLPILVTLILPKSVIYSQTRLKMAFPYFLAIALRASYYDVVKYRLFKVIFTIKTKPLEKVHIM